MGQKVHPYGFRLGYTKTWLSRWYAKGDYGDLLQEDLKIRDTLKKRLRAAGVSRIEIERPGHKLRIIIHTARPGLVIGRRGSEIDKLKQELAKQTGRDVSIDIHEVHRPELDAQLVAESIALQLEKRVAFRRAMRKAVDSAMRYGCQGIKVRVSGRLNGAEIARSEWYLQGRLPLQTLRADIDYGFAEAFTKYGVIGVKTWIYKGEIFERPVLGGIREPEPFRPRRQQQEAGPAQTPPTAPEAQPTATKTSERPEGGVVVQPPASTETGATSVPITPPLMPPQPAWKQELKEEDKKAATEGQPAQPEPEAQEDSSSAPQGFPEPDRSSSETENGEQP